MASTVLQSRAGGYRAEMDAAERASRDEIVALQTKRLAWSLAHAYDNVAHYKKAFDAAGVHPLLLAIGSERYWPFAETQRPQELLTQANAILGQGRGGEDTGKERGRCQP